MNRATFEWKPKFAWIPTKVGPNRIWLRSYVAIVKWTSVPHACHDCGHPVTPCGSYGSQEARSEEVGRMLR